MNCGIKKSPSLENTMCKIENYSDKCIKSHTSICSFTIAITSETVAVEEKCNVRSSSKPRK